MMKKLLLFSILIPVLYVFPQTRFVDTPLGIGAGYIGGWFFPKTNALMGQGNTKNIASQGFYVSGGGGFVYLYQPLRVGGYGFGGSHTQKTALNEQTDYSVGGGALTIEYTFPYIKFFAVSIGAGIGGGSVQMDVYKNNGSIDWNSLNNGQANNSYHKTLKATYASFTPQIAIDIPYLRIINFRLSGSYQFTFAESLRADDNIPVVNSPSNINYNGFSIQAGVFVGLFFY